jgi:hypothetical protein
MEGGDEEPRQDQATSPPTATSPAPHETGPAYPTPAPAHTRAIEGSNSSDGSESKAATDLATVAPSRSSGRKEWNPDDEPEIPDCLKAKPKADRADPVTKLAGGDVVGNDVPVIANRAKPTTARNRRADLAATKTGKMRKKNQPTLINLSAFEYLRLTFSVAPKGNVVIEIGVWKKATPERASHAASKPITGILAVGRELRDS